jgi:chromosome partitioning protein
MTRGLPVIAADRSGSRQDVPSRRFDFADRTTWAPALEGVDRVFLLRPPAVSKVEETLNPFVDEAYKRGVTHVVLDSPAGIHGHLLKDALRVADRIIVPLQASLFDIYATQAFLQKLAERTGLKESGHVGVLGMRVDARTRAAEQLHRFVDGLGLPVLGFLRDTQNYVQLAAHGLSLWDVAPSRVEKDVAQWHAMLAWVETGALPPTPEDESE